MAIQTQSLPTPAPLRLIAPASKRTKEYYETLLDATSEGTVITTDRYIPIFVRLAGLHIIHDIHYL